MSIADRAMASLIVVDVWSNNVRQEFAELAMAVKLHPVIAFDTEFPGCLRNTLKSATEAERYNDLRFNVKPTNIIQLGITLSDHDGNIYYKTWQFNFKFDLDVEVWNSTAIDFLRATGGINFEKLKSDGIDMAWFRAMFSRIVGMHKARLTWVTFHGLYDFGYVLQMVTNFGLPDCISSFTSQLKLVIGDVLDIKHMAKFCPRLRGGELGLEMLASILGVKRIGSAHQAGSDSLLTALVYEKMRQIYSLKQHVFVGLLYGIAPAVSTSFKQPARNCLHRSQRVGVMVKNVNTYYYVMNSHVQNCHLL